MVQPKCMSPAARSASYMELLFLVFFCSRSLTAHTHSLITHSLITHSLLYIFIPPLKLHHFATAFTSLLLGLPEHNRQHSRVCRVTSRHVTSRSPSLPSSGPVVTSPPQSIRLDSSDRVCERAKCWLPCTA